MDNTEIILKLQRDVRRMKIALVSVGGVALAAVLIGATAPLQNATFDRITAHRIDITEPDGKTRAILTDAAEAPGPMIHGHEGKRIVTIGGLILFNKDGNERGGVGTLDGARGSFGATLLDYDHTEALGMYRQTAPDGTESATIFINDPPAKGMSPEQAASTNHQRIALQNPDGNAQILLSDTNGKPRIRLGVDKAGVARIEVLDADGKVVFHAPN
jgi:hypothetical protein